MFTRFLNFLLLIFLLGKGFARYRWIQSITDSKQETKRSEYELLELTATVAPSGTQHGGPTKVSTEEACASLCLKEESRGCGSFAVETNNDDDTLMCKLGPLITDRTNGDVLVFVKKACQVLKVVSKSYGGLYEYTDQLNGRPAYVSKTRSTLCLFFRDHWKVEGCGNKHKWQVGLLFSNTTKNFAQETGLTWKYYANRNTQEPDTDIVVTCNY